MLLGFDTRLQGRHRGGSKMTPDLVPQIGDGPVVHGCRRSPTTGLSHRCELYRITMFMVLQGCTASNGPHEHLGEPERVGAALPHDVAGIHEVAPRLRHALVVLARSPRASPCRVVPVAAGPPGSARLSILDFGL